MIKSFNCKETEKIWNGGKVKKFSFSIQRQALKKLRMIDVSENIEDLKIPRGNNLERLKGNRKNQYSVRINARWRICFYWGNGNATKLEIVDYH